MEVRHITGDVERRDLTLAFGVLAEASDYTFNDEAGVVDRLIESHEIAVRLHLRGMYRQVQDGLLFGFGKERAAGEPVEEALKIRSVLVGHDELPTCNREHVRSLSHRSLRPSDR